MPFAGLKYGTEVGAGAKIQGRGSKERPVCYKQGTFASQEARSIALDSDWRAKLKSAM